MSTVIDQPRNDVPIVADATLLAVPNMNDEAARTEYLKKLRALRDTSPEAAAPTPDDLDQQPDTEDVTEHQEITEDATAQPSAEHADQPSQGNKIRLSAQDLTDYEIPVVDEDGNTVYLSYDEFNKTVGTYSKQNKKLRELADREREVEAIKNNLIQEQARVLQSTVTAEAKMAERYAWIQDSLAFAHQHNLDTITFEDGTNRKVTQLIAEKTALETGYNQLMARREQAKQAVTKAQQDFVTAQDEILEKRAPTVRKARTDIARYLEREGFTQQEANALAHAKAELLILLDKARRYDDAQRSPRSDKKIASNTKVLRQPSRLAGRGTPVATPTTTRMQELQAKGTRATADELRELRRLQTQKP